MQELIINYGLVQTEVALVKNNVIHNIYLDRKSMPTRVGNVYYGKVVRILLPMNLAFVDIGLEKTALLKINKTNVKQYKIQVNSLILVQLTHDPIQDKGAKLSLYINLCSPNLVFTPFESGLSISNKIQDKAAQEKLLASSHIFLKLPGKVIIRTGAQFAATLDMDIKYLSDTWQNISDSTKKIGLVWQELSQPLSILRDNYHQIDRISVNTKSLQATVQQFLKYYNLQHLISVKLQLDNSSFTLGLNKKIKQCLERIVDLPSGGTIVFDKTEAMHVIDVNSSKDTTQKGKYSNALNVNLEALTVLIAEIRLRNLAGCIVIDFIPLTSNNEIVVFKKELSSLFSTIGAKVINKQQLIDNLVYVTRKKIGYSLIDMMCTSCSSCHGSGIEISNDSICVAILKNIEDKYFKSDKNKVIVQVSSNIKKTLASYHEIIILLEEKINKNIIIEEEKSYSRTEYKLIVN